MRAGIPSYDWHNLDGQVRAGQAKPVSGLRIGSEFVTNGLVQAVSVDEDHLNTSNLFLAEPCFLHLQSPFLAALRAAGKL